MITNLKYSPLEAIKIVLKNAAFFKVLDAQQAY